VGSTCWLLNVQVLTVACHLLVTASHDPFLVQFKWN